MRIAEKIRTKDGGRLCLTGNEAIVRGALEAGVGFVSGYPGTPASEIGDIFRELSHRCGIKFEDSVNEKVAVETAFTASLLGVRALSAMKHLGLAYAGDPLGTIPYVGISGGFVLVSGGDPGMVVSPNEQDQRYAARMLHIPAFDPATPQDACDMCRFAFELSEETKLPILLRTTIHVNFARGVVRLRTLPARAARKIYVRSPEEHVPIPANARRMRAELKERIERAEAILAKSPFFPRFGEGRVGIVSCGASTNYVLDAASELGLEDRALVLYLGCVYPVPSQVIREFFRSVDQVLVVEELLPFVEETLKVKAQELGFGGKILGKSSGHLPGTLSLDPDIVREAVSAYVEGKAPGARFSPAGRDEERGVLAPEQPGESEAIEPPLPQRPPVLCAGCPHRSTFFAVKLVLGPEALCCSDIGCYTLGYGPPLESADMLLCMGSSITMASAASRLGRGSVVAYIGDSTFFHSGLPALANAVRNRDDIIVVVMDNQAVAMTGHQPSFSSGVPRGGSDPPRERVEAGRAISIEETARALGAKVWVLDPDDPGEMVRAVFRIASEEGVRLLVSRKTCPLSAFRSGEKKREKVYRVDRSLCRHCGHEGKSLYCAEAVPREYERQMALIRVLSIREGSFGGGEGEELPKERASGSLPEEGLAGGEVRFKGEKAPRVAPRGITREDEDILPEERAALLASRQEADETPIQYPRAPGKEPGLPRGASAILGSHDGAPCSRACPVNICIQGYVGRVAAGDYQGALRLIRMRNPLPVVSSFVCHRPCERVCTAAASGKPVAINRIKEFLVLWERENRRKQVGADRPPQPDKIQGEKSRRVAVIGAGPAGLTCAFDLSRRGYDVTVFDAHDKPGGMLEQAIPSYRLPREMLAYEFDAALARGARFVPGKRFDQAGAVEGLLSEGFEAICIASGAHKPKSVEGIEVGGIGKKASGREAAGPVGYALDFLKDVNAGKTGRVEGHIIVTGGGDCAIDAARTAVRLGAESVTILYRRSLKEMPAHPSEVEGALSEGVKIICHGEPVRIDVRGRRINKVVFQKMRPGELDSSGRRKPLPIAGEVFDLRADLVLLAVGEEPGETGVFEDLGLKVRPDGTLVVDPLTGETSRRGVFAAGDVTGGPRTVLDAIAGGKRAAFGIDRFLSGRAAAPLEFLRPYEEGARAVGSSAFLETGTEAGLAGFSGERAGAFSYRTVTCKDTGGNFTVIEKEETMAPEDFSRPLLPLREDEARKLASRCLLCGACGECSTCLDLFGCPAMFVEEGKVAIDEALCTGCGLCALFCPNRAIIEVPLS